MTDRHSVRDIRSRIQGGFTCGLLLLSLIVVFSGCGTAEKYKKSETESEKAPVERELAVQVPVETQEWLRDLTGRMHAADLTCALGDTAAAVHLADSLLLVAEAIVDTLEMESPLQRVLLLFIVDGYGRYVLWEKDPEARKVLTDRHAALAARLQERMDSLSRKQ